MSSKVIDYDAFRGEQTQEAPKIIVGGEEYTLATSIPASVILDAVRLKKEYGDDIELSTMVIDSMGVSLFGEVQWRSMLAKNQISIMELPNLIRVAVGAYFDDPKALSQILPTMPFSSLS